MKIVSSDGNKFYDVTSSSCTCPDYVYRQAKSGGKCKHMIKHFFPWIKSQELTTEGILTTQDREYFKNGISDAEAYLKYGDRLDELISKGELCKVYKGHKTVIYILE